MSEQRERDREGASGTAELEAEVARLDDRFKRALADLDNYRKRTAKDVDRRIAEGTDALLADWLEVADSVQRALMMTPLDDGLRAVDEQIEVTLARQQVTRLGEVGEPFDPDRHEAVAVAPATDRPDGTVVEVIRPGYARDGRVLRPALVAVAQRPRGDDAAHDKPTAA
ncbi:MAG: nucleotide exchange factor GrpE [Baekduia sp.]